MKKRLIYILLFLLPGITHAQSTPGSIRLSALDSIQGVFNTTVKTILSRQQSDARYAPKVGGGYVSSVSGTTNRITSTGGTTPVIDISSSYVGQTSITTLGTILTGTWNGTAIGDTYIATSTNWNTAYSDRLKWDGGATGLTASTGRTSLGGTTVGQNLFTLTNPSAITFPRINADNSVSALDAATFRTAIGAGNFTSPLTTTGDIIYSSSGTTAARRAIGTTGDILQVSGGVPVWSDGSSTLVTVNGSQTIVGTKTFSNAATFNSGITNYTNYIAQIGGGGIIAANGTNNTSVTLTGDATASYINLNRTNKTIAAKVAWTSQSSTKWDLGLQGSGSTNTFSLKWTPSGASVFDVDTLQRVTFLQPLSATSFSGNITQAAASGNNLIIQNRINNTVAGLINLKTNGTDDWAIGQVAGAGDSDYHIYSYGLGNDAIKVARSNGAATLYAALTGTSATFSGTGAFLSSVGATTNSRYIRIGNAGSDSYLMAEASVAATSWTNSLAYATVLGSAGSTAVQLAANGAVGFTLLSSGNVGVGTTIPTSFGAGITNLAVNGSTQGILSTMYNGTDGLRMSSSSAGGFLVEPRNLPLEFRTNGTTALTIASNQAIRYNTYGAGTLVTDGSGNVTASSDSTLKTFLKDKNGIEIHYNRGLKEILAISKLTGLFNWNEASGLNQTDLNIGWKAQLVKPIIPEAIGIAGNGKLTLSERPILAASLNAISEINIVVQESMKRIEALEENIKKQSKRILALENLIIAKPAAKK